MFITVLNIPLSFIYKIKELLVTKKTHNWKNNERIILLYNLLLRYM